MGRMTPRTGHDRSEAQAIEIALSLPAGVAYAVSSLSFLGICEWLAVNRLIGAAGRTGGMTS